MSYTAVILKVVFPSSSPIATKTFNLDASITVAKAITQIADQVGSSVGVRNPGLYVEEKDLWLDERKLLHDYSDLLKQVEGIHFKERGHANQSSGETSNLLMWGAVGAVVAVAVVAGIYIFRQRR